MEKHAMELKKLSGFEEIEHTADLSLKVWASTVEDLFVKAVSGLNQIICAEINNEVEAISKELNLDGIDMEDLLVSLLSEINYLLQAERLSTDICKIRILSGKLSAEVLLKQIIGYKREVKAVTYHNLKINHKDNIYSTVIVFDI